MTKNNWISPKEKLPKHLERVVIKIVNHFEHGDNTSVRLAIYCQNGEGKPIFISGTSAVDFEDIIGWISENEYKMI